MGPGKKKRFPAYLRTGKCPDQVRSRAVRPLPFSSVGDNLAVHTFLFFLTEFQGYGLNSLQKHPLYIRSQGGNLPILGQGCQKLLNLASVP